jgi:hypothetical protein
MIIAVENIRIELSVLRPARVVVRLPPRSGESAASRTLRNSGACSGEIYLLSQNKYESCYLLYLITVKLRESILPVRIANPIEVCYW